MTLLPGVGVGDVDDVVVSVGDAAPDVVGVALGGGVVLPLTLGVTEGEGDADGEVLGTTAPPTALPARQTKTYSVAPIGGLKITGVGDTDAAELLATTGTDATGGDACFVGVAREGVGAGLGGGLVGVLFAGGTTGTIGLAEAELADAAEADWAATCCLMKPGVVTRP